MRPDIRPNAPLPNFEFPDRPSSADLHADLRDVTKKVRPDFQIDTPEGRQKWEENDKDAFYPYGKLWGQVFVRIAGAVDQLEDQEGSAKGTTHLPRPTLLASQHGGFVFAGLVQRRNYLVD